MSPLVVERISYGPRATIGLMRWSDVLLYTLEDAWANNKPMLSCIPDGVYRCRPRRFNRGGYMAVEVRDVPGRSNILIHRGNTADDVTGCLLVGRFLDAFRGVIAVLDSAWAWGQFFPVWGEREFDLVLKPIHPLAGTRAYQHQEET